jgi:hypothetical protein
MQMMHEEFEVENEGIMIPTQVHWLVNPRTSWKTMQNGEIDALSVVLVVEGSKVAQGLLQKGIKMAVVWDQVETYKSQSPDTGCELCSR